MKMVAASKLKKAQVKAQASQPYAQSIKKMLARVTSSLDITNDTSKLLIGTGNTKKHLLVVISSDRGLCGGFNTNIIRFAQTQIKDLKEQGKDVQLLLIGRKAKEGLRRQYNRDVLKSYSHIMGKKDLSFTDIKPAIDLIMDQFHNGNVDVCSIIYNHFHSVLLQTPVKQQLIPIAIEAKDTDIDSASDTPYSFEPNQETLLAELLPKNINIQLFGAVLDSAAGEQAARMTAMDNATRNAGEKIKALNLTYNRARQAHITKELIEIISGAEAL
jgi:F-type H+-transporting ATPase subunit gamma